MAQSKTLSLPKQKIGTMKLAIEKTYPDERRSYEPEKRMLMEELINSTPYDSEVRMRMVMILQATPLVELEKVFGIKQGILKGGLEDNWKFKVVIKVWSDFPDLRKHYLFVPAMIG